MYFNKKKEEEENRSNLSVKFVPYQRFDTAAKPHTRQVTNTHPKKENNTLNHNTRRCKTHTHSVEQQFFV